MAKSRTTPEFKIILCKKYLSEEGSCRDLAKANGIDARTPRRWVKNFSEYGEDTFYISRENVHYSKRFKLQCVADVLNGYGTLDDITIKYFEQQCPQLLANAVQ